MTPIEKWLAYATHALSYEATAQVQAEIREHYRSTYSQALVQGSTEEEAHRIALAALGDAVSANRQYRRVLLTAREARYLSFLNPPDPSLLSPARITLGKSLAGILYAEALAWMVYVSWKQSPWVFAILPFPFMLLARELLPINTPLRGLIYRSAKWIAFIGGTLLANYYAQPGWPGWLPFGALLYPAYTEYMRISIRRKLPMSQWPARLYQ